MAREAAEEMVKRDITERAERRRVAEEALDVRGLLPGVINDIMMTVDGHDDDHGGYLNFLNHFNADLPPLPVLFGALNFAN